jgi:hypothetical protein
MIPDVTPGSMSMRLGRPPVEATAVATAGEATQVSLAIDELRASASARAVEPVRALELVWFSAKLPARTRRLSGWAPTRPEGEDPSPERDVVRALVRAPPSPPDLEGDLFASAGESGALSPPLRALAGDLAFPFDEVDALGVLLVAARPAARAAPKLAELLDLAREAAKLDLPMPPEVAADLASSICEAWAQANRALPADHLARQVERSLLLRRCYQRRELLGGRWLRALFTPAGASKPVPAYLPASLASRLPLFTSFGARVIADVVPRQDHLEASPVALRVSALAREIVREGP